MGMRWTLPSLSVTRTVTARASGAQSLKERSSPRRCEPMSWYVVGAYEAVGLLRSSLRLPSPITAHLSLPEGPSTVTPHSQLRGTPSSCSATLASHLPLPSERMGMEPTSHWLLNLPEASQL